VKKLIYQIIATASAIDAAGTIILKPFGLTPMTYNILNVLKEGALSQREISERVIVAASSITFQVRQLQKKGLIQRRRSDARTWRVSLTPLGEERRLHAEQRMDQVIDRVQVDPMVVASAEAALKAVQDRFPQLS
jgi:DNA-binding MarR family transcriptional regulator